MSHTVGRIAAGVEFQVLHDGDFTYCRRWPTRAIALLEAENDIQPTTTHRVPYKTAET